MSRFANQLVIFAKAPRLGTVKSRLAADLGEVEARRIYQNLTAQTLALLKRDPRWQTTLALTPDKDALAGFRLSAPGLARRPQGPGDLGDKMDRIFQALPSGPVIIVGTDIPALKPEKIARAFKALGHHDAVIGPAEDGGYWLIGLKRRPRAPLIFDAVRWSSPHAMADTLRNIKKEIPGAQIKRLELLEDIDDIASYRKWQNQQRK